MKYLSSAAIVLVFAGMLVLPSKSALAVGPYSNTLAKCLVSKTTDAEKTLMVEWVFSALSANPKVASIARMNYSQRQVITQKTAELFKHLLFDVCHKQAKQAVEYEGPIALYYSFKVLGTVASRELMSDPAVKRQLKGINKFIDKKKMNEELGLDTDD